jgi:hypothetical protein
MKTAFTLKAIKNKTEPPTTTPRTSKHPQRQNIQDERESLTKLRHLPLFHSRRFSWSVVGQKHLNRNVT